MISKLKIDSFKSIQSAELELGRVNVFIGANGSGKSNLLEALSLLSAAASGKVDQSTLVWRGCRASYFFRPMFEGCDIDADAQIEANGESESYNVVLKPPQDGRLLPWEFRSERWERDGTVLVDRRPETNGSRTDPHAGLAALRLAETYVETATPAFLKSLGAYSIYSAASPILHGWTQDPQEREPLGLGGGRLPQAMNELLKVEGVGTVLHDEFHESIDWYSLVAAQGETNNLWFRDRYFRIQENHLYLLGRNDVNEGVLYLAFLAVLGLHPLAPQLFAVENFDHGLNPLLARRLAANLCSRILASEQKRQAFLTTHNPLVLDGLPLGDDRVRLFTLDRDNKGRSVVRRFVVTDRHREMAKKGWTLSRMWINKLIGGVPDV